VIHRLLVDEVELVLVAAQVELVPVEARVELHLFQDRGEHLGLAHLRTLLELPTTVLRGVIV